ncbi:MAG TPA: LPS export ABC transporter permease LptG [Candidatus Limnocylindria bacterium]|nr:LPS export ABC transporter permease LptG [Candidatus Limnocylindria bacterium]
MRLYPTFAGYLGRQFLLWCAYTFVALVFLIGLFDTIEQLRRTSSDTDISLGIVVAMSLFKLPFLAEQAVPFAVLFGGMMAFWRLNRHHEVVVVRATGMSAWEFLMPVLLIALVIGVVQVTIYSPFASAMLLHFERLEAQYTHGKESLAAISNEGLWLRQRTKDGHYVLHAKTIQPQQMRLGDVLVLGMHSNDRFAYRIDADQAVLERGAWRLTNARLTGPSGPPVQRDVYRLPTDLTRANIQDSFAMPETLSFWSLPAFIAVLERAGFSALRHRLYFQSQIAVPLLLCAMVLFAASFTLRPLRRGGTSILIGAGVVTGFVIHFASDVVYALGLSARIPVALSAWSPAIIGCLLGAAILFHLEDG